MQREMETEGLKGECPVPSSRGQGMQTLSASFREPPSQQRRIYTREHGSTTDQEHESTGAREHDECKCGGVTEIQGHRVTAVKSRANVLIILSGSETPDVSTTR